MDTTWPDAAYHADTMEPALTIHGLTVCYASASALFSVDYTAATASMNAIVGPNGAGKSTLIKAALGITPRVSGDILFFGQPLSRVRARVAYVPQRASIDWHFPATAYDVVAMGMYRELGWLRPWRRPHRLRVLSCLDQVGMGRFASRQIGQLSGGQQQRVFVARALAQNADLFILDEPFAGIDAATERAIATLLHRLAGTGKTVICVHHDLATVPEYFDFVMLLNVRNIAIGPVRTIFTPEKVQEAYGGQLTPGQLDRLRRDLACRSATPATTPVAAP